MSNDLIFPILPREGKVPVKPDDRVKKVSKEAETKGLGEDERYEHDEERPRQAHACRDGHVHGACALYHPRAVFFGVGRARK